ncbi:MAG TPA: tripartite tricarboxylate transporter substrate binding protein [Ramlibacter sp.]|nr:tripartite tricarboxylate transporter substrate binding protein [Ramlibacter sp.]
MLYRRTFAALPLLLTIHVRSAEQDYPVKPIRLLIGYAPGSGADVVARLLAAKLQETLKQGVIVENKAGAGGIVAAQEAARAPADGYTLLLGALPQMGIAPATHPKLPYDPVKDFSPVLQVAATDMVLITNPQRVPSGSLQEFIAWAGKQPYLFFGTAGPGTLSHFGAYLAAEAIKAKIEPVHFKTTGDQLTAMLKGDIHAQFVPVATAAPLVKAGKLRALVTTGPDRSSILSDTPTSKEAGYPAMQFVSWYGVFAPANTPSAILDKINGAVLKAWSSADARGKLEDSGMRGLGASRQAFSRLIKDDIDRWTKVVKATGFKAQE